MLINLWGTVSGKTIIFDSLPFISLNNHEIGVKEILIEWKTTRTSFIGMLTTSLIEKSPYNLHQELLLIPQEYSGKFLY